MYLIMFLKKNPDQFPMLSTFYRIYINMYTTLMQALLTSPKNILQHKKGDKNILILMTNLTMDVQGYHGTRKFLHISSAYIYNYREASNPQFYL